MADPSKVLWQYLEATHKADTWCSRWYQFGQLAMALEICTLIKNLESIPVATEVGRQETVSALQTLLVGMGLADLAWDTYARLAEWRVLKFLPLSDEQPDAELSGSDDADERELPDPLDGLSSRLASPPESTSRTDSSRASPGSRRSRDGDSSDEREESPDVEAEGRSSD